MVIEYLVVGGGGGGGASQPNNQGGESPATGGGGGGGRVHSGSYDLPQGNHVVTVGGGGAGGANGGFGGAGGASGFVVTAHGGLSGAAPHQNAPSGNGDQNGGGGGGGGAYFGGNVWPSLIGWKQGANGSAAVGGGAAGNAANGAVGGAGGIGTWNDYNGAAYFGSGGGGGGSNGVGGVGAWGAGNGGGTNQAGGLPTYYGCGGGGAGNQTTDPGGSWSGLPGGYGFGGCVIVRYAGAQVMTGGTVSSVNGYTVHLFAASGTLSFILPVPAISYIAPATAYRGEDTYIDFIGSGFAVGGSTIVPWTAGGMSLASGTIYGSTTNIAVNIRLAANAALGANHALAVSTAGGQSGWAYVTAAQRPPVISSTDRPSGVAGEYLGLNIFGSQFCPESLSIAVSGDGITVSSVTYVDAGHVYCYLQLAGVLTHGARNVTVSHVGGTSNAASFFVNAVPTITMVDNTGVAPNDVNDVNFLRGASHYTHVWGNGFTAPNITGAVSGAGVTATYAADGGPTLIALSITPAVDAPLGARTLTVTATGGVSNAWPINIIPQPPTLTSTDRPQHLQGQVNVYTHFWGTNLTNPCSGTVSGTGVTISFAAYGGETLVAMHISVAADAPLGTRQVTLTTPGGTSNALTFEIIPQTPTITAVTGRGGSAAQCFIGVKQVVQLTGTNFVPGGTTVNVSAGLTKGTVNIYSSTVIYVDITGTVVGNESISVTTVGGTSVPATLAVIAITALPSAGFILNQIIAVSSNQHIGPLGTVFTVGAKDRLVTHLGRWKFASGNTRRHTLLLRDGNYAEVARAVIDLNQATAGQWNYVALPAPVKLKAGSRYSISDMDCFWQGDLWASVTPLAHDANGTINGILIEASSMYSFTPGTNRVDTHGVGFRFTAAGAYGITCLGRWKFPGNTQPHRIVLKDAAGTILREGVVDFRSGKGVENQFNYVPIQYMELTAGAVYYLLSEESGGDVWTDAPNTVNPWGGIQNTGAVWEGFPVVNGVVPPGVGMPNNTMWSAPDIICITSGWSNLSEGYVTTNLKWQDAQQPMAMLI